MMPTLQSSHSTHLHQSNGASRVVSPCHKVKGIASPYTSPKFAFVVGGSFSCLVPCLQLTKISSNYGCNTHVSIPCVHYN